MCIRAIQYVLPCFRTEKLVERAHVACKANDMELLRSQLSRNPPIVNAVDVVSGDALIHVACRENKPEILLLLVAEYNADVNVMTRGNISAARIAYDKGYIDCLKILAEKNAIDSHHPTDHHKSCGT